MKKRNRVAAAGAAVLVAALTFGAAAQWTKTPAAGSFGVWGDDPEHLIVGVVEPVSGTDEGVGFTIRCERARGLPEGTMAFGFFPTGRSVQAAVRSPSGRVERFGPVVSGDATTGFHAPVPERRSEVLRLMAAAMTDGALISSGRHSVRNRVGKAGNREAREALPACSGGQG